MPITWKNVNQPNFGASNNLMVSGGKTITDSIANASNILKQQGEYNRQKNTGQAIAQMGAINDLQNAAQQRQAIVDQWNGRNVDMSKINAAGQNQVGFLQGNETFADNQAIKDFQIENQEADRNLDVEAKQTGIDAARYKLNRDRYAASDAGKKEAADAAEAKFLREEAAKITLAEEKAKIAEKKAVADFEREREGRKAAKAKPDEFLAANSDIGSKEDTWTYEGSSRETLSNHMASFYNQGYTRAQLERAKQHGIKESPVPGIDMDAFLEYMKNESPQEEPRY